MEYFLLICDLPDRGKRKAGNGGGGNDKIVSGGGGPISKQSLPHIVLKVNKVKMQVKECVI